MILGLSILSSEAVLLLLNSQYVLLDSMSWQKTDGRELADDLELRTQQLLSRNSANAGDLKKLFGFSGPGSFTGLRVSAAFLKGLSAGLGIPLAGISTFQIFGEPVAISLRAHKASALTLEQCLTNGYKFLENYIRYGH